MTDNRESLLDKIRALLSKTVANGCTEAEAMAALAKARAMMDAHEVSDAELSLTKDEKAILRREPPGSKDPNQIKAMLATAVAKFCECQVWRDREKKIVFCGLRPDAQFATWLLDTLAAHVRQELVMHLIGSIAEGRDRRRVIKGFAIGCTSRISERLAALCVQSRPQTDNARALVVVKGQAVAAKMAELNLHLRSRSSSTSAYDRDSLYAGRAAGDRASFGRPVSGSNATLRIGGRS